MMGKKKRIRKGKELGITGKRASTFFLYYSRFPDFYIWLTAVLGCIISSLSGPHFHIPPRHTLVQNAQNAAKIRFFQSRWLNVTCTEMALTSEKSNRRVLAQYARSTLAYNPGVTVGGESIVTSDIPNASIEYCFDYWFLGSTGDQRTRSIPSTRDEAY